MPELYFINGGFMKRSIFITFSWVFICALNLNAASPLSDLQLNKLNNCKYTFSSSRSLIGDRFVSGENLRWIHSKSITSLIRSMDTWTNTPYPFAPISDTYITPEGFQVMVAGSKRTELPNFDEVIFVSFAEIGFVKDTFDLMANYGPIVINGQEVIIGNNLICNSN